MVTQVVSSNPTHEESHSSFYEGYHGDYDFFHLLVKCYPFQRIVSQGCLLGYVILLFEYFYQSRAIH